MIRFSLRCGSGHDFESWFQSGAAFDDLLSRRLVSCAICGDTEVRKSMMAPKIARGGADEPAGQTMVAGPLSQPGSELERMIAALRRKVEETSTYVGRDFAREARQMHLGEVPERQIHGEATADEARSLIEDGVPVLPLPGLPKSKSN